MSPQSRSSCPAEVKPGQPLGGSRRRFACLGAAITALLMLVAGAAAADTAPAKPRHGTKEKVPDAVCFRTTITDKGHTRNIRIIRESGNRQSDNAAQRVVRITKLVNDIGVEREAHVLVNWYGVGYTIGFFELDEELPAVCTRPPPGRARKP